MASSPAAATKSDPASSASSSALLRLERVEQRLASAVRLASLALQELVSGQSDASIRHAKQFMDAVTEVQVSLRKEIGNIWDYHPQENCDYLERLKAQICLEKVQWVEQQCDELLSLLKTPGQGVEGSQGAGGDANPE